MKGLWREDHPKLKMTPEVITLAKDLADKLMGPRLDAALAETPKETRDEYGDVHTAAVIAFTWGMMAAYEHHDEMTEAMWQEDA